MATVVRAKRIYAEQGTVEDGALWLSGSRISRIESAGGVTPGSEDRVFDFPGDSIIPGLLDIHTHGLLDVDLLQCTAGELSVMSGELARHGVTGFLPSIITTSNENLFARVEAVRQAQKSGVPGARILGVDLEGPWLCHERRGAHPAKYLRVPARGEVEEILAETRDLVKKVTFSPEVEGARWLTERLAAAGILPAMGHTNATFAQAMQAIRAGARYVTHMFNAMLGFHEKPEELGTVEPGIETAALLEDPVTVEILATPAFLDPAIYALVWKLKGPDRVVLATDGNRGTGCPVGYTMGFPDGRKAVVRDDAIRLVEEGPYDNALLGVTETLERMLHNFVSFTGIPLEQALRTVSLNPATCLGIERELGSLAVGKRADLAVVDEGMTVKMTLVDGNVVYLREQAGQTG